MTQTRIPRDALVFVGDGAKALFLRNKGDAERSARLVGGGWRGLAPSGTRGARERDDGAR